MKLNHITEEKCESCGSAITSESKLNQHCSGEWNETRRFACGRALSYSPNFRAISVTNPCPESQHEKDKNTKRKNAKEKLNKYINKMDIDDNFRKSILSRLEYI